MKPILVTLASYHVWANQLLTQAVLSMDEDLQQRIIPSSFPSLYTTILHMWDAESIWWQRMKLHERLVIPSKEFNPTTREAVNGLMQQARQWEEWVKGASEPALQHTFAYRNSKKEEFKQPIYEMLLHLFNHGTYHRGQLVTMMRALGREDIPGTDLMLFCRKK